MKSLDENVRTRFFKFVDGKEFLMKKRFLFELYRNWKTFISKLKDGIDNLGKEDYIDENLLKLVKFLSKNAVDTDCLRKLPAERLVDANIMYTNPLWNYYFDFDFIDAGAYLNYKLSNKLNLNRKVNILIGAVSDEDCSTKLLLKDIYPTDQFNAPAIPKVVAKKVIKASSYLVTGMSAISFFNLYIL